MEKRNKLWILMLFTTFLSGFLPPYWNWGGARLEHLLWVWVPTCGLLAAIAALRDRVPA